MATEIKLNKENKLACVPNLSGKGKGGERTGLGLTFQLMCSYIVSLHDQLVIEPFTLFAFLLFFLGVSILFAAC